MKLVPIESDLEDLIESQFKEEVKHQGFVELESLPESPYWPYCKLWIHGRKPIIIAPPQSSNGISIPFNIQIARYSLASLIGKPELVDWKKCVLTLEEETELTEKYRKILVFE